MAKKTFNTKKEIQKILDKTDLDEKLISKINDLLYGVKIIALLLHQP